MICSKFIRTLYRARMQLLIGRTSYSEFYLTQAVIVVLGCISSINTQCMYDYVQYQLCRTFRRHGAIGTSH
jgi:hypothetical protein